MAHPRQRLEFIYEKIHETSLYTMSKIKKNTEFEREDPPEFPLISKVFMKTKVLLEVKPNHAILDAVPIIEYCIKYGILTHRHRSRREAM